MAENPRTESARAHDDSDLLEGGEPMPSQSGTSGAGPAENIGTRDEMKQATGDEPTSTRVRKGDKADTFVPTRADMDG
jgi:hypothetical protein